MHCAEYFPQDLTPAVPLETWQVGRGASLQRRQLTADQVRSIACSLRERGENLRRLPTRKILRALARVHRGWSRSGSTRREEAVTLLQEVTGYPAYVLDRSLQSLFRVMSSEEMAWWLGAGGVSQLAQLDPTPSALEKDLFPLYRYWLAFGPSLTAVIASGNIPGAAVPSVVQALLLRSPCFVKSSSNEPVLLTLYARSVAEEAPELGEALVIASWEGGQADLEQALLAEMDALIAYGSNETLERLRSRLPVHARFIGYGHRISFSAVGRELLTRRKVERAAERAALDLCLFDQQGCLSPQAIYVERGGDLPPEQFAEALAQALEGLERRLPRQELDPGEAAAIHQFRASVEMRSITDEAVRLWTSAEGTRWTVVLEPDPALTPCCLNRTAVIHPVDHLEELPRWIAPCRPLLMSAALGVGKKRRDRLARVLAAAGVTRLTELGQAQLPETFVYHDGINAIGTLARFVGVGC
jgi:acyl-CoA reductase LuxC